MIFIELSIQITLQQGDQAPLILLLYILFSVQFPFLKMCRACILHTFQVKGEKPPAPTLGVAPKGGDGGDEEDGAEEGGGGGEDNATPAVNLADLVPRNDIRYGCTLVCLTTA